MSATRADIEKVVAQQQSSRRDPPGHIGGTAEVEQGTYQVQRMVPPKPMPGMLNQEMAEAAAKKYEKDKKKIQKACAEVDGTATTTTQRCSCIIL
jgi:hypothetical protein